MKDAAQRRMRHLRCSVLELRLRISLHTATYFLHVENYVEYNAISVACVAGSTR